MTPSPTPSLPTYLLLFPPPLRLSIALAARHASLSSTLLRFTRHLDSDSSPSEERDREARAFEGARKVAKEAGEWLDGLLSYLDVRREELGDEERRSKKGVDEGVKYEVAHELVLYSLGLLKEKEEGGKLDYGPLERMLVVRTCRVLGVEIEVVWSVEKAVAQFLYFKMSEEEERVKNQGEPEGGKKVEGEGGWREAARVKMSEGAVRGNPMRWAAMGAGFVLGGVAIGLTGGLAAPAIAHVLVGAFGMSVFGGAGGAVLIGTLFGLGGGGLASYRTHHRMKGLDELVFEPILVDDVPSIPSLTVSIVASGFLIDASDSVEPWRASFVGRDAFAVKADSATFLEAGQHLDKFVRNTIIRSGSVEVIKRTVLHAVWAGLALPWTVLSASSALLDSGFSRCSGKAQTAGILLAEILEQRIQGNRPCTLVGYGPGAQIIFSALLELHRRDASSLVYEAILISLPTAPTPLEWSSARTVVAHRLVNCYSSQDWVLAIQSRLYNLTKEVAGLGECEGEGVENVDVGDLVLGHLELRDKVGEILTRVAESS